MQTIHDMHARLLMAVTEHDRRERSKRHYNRNALGIYCGAVTNAFEAMKQGAAPREAVLGCFTGRLLDRCLTAIGEKPATAEEHRGGFRVMG